MFFSCPSSFLPESEGVCGVCTQDSISGFYFEGARVGICLTRLGCYFSMPSWCPYPVHSEQNTRPSLGITVVRILKTRTLAQPGPFELTGLPLGTLLQVILHEVSRLRAANVLPLLSSVVVRWRRRRGKKKEERERERINKADSVPDSGL